MGHNRECLLLLSASLLGACSDDTGDSNLAAGMGGVGTLGGTTSTLSTVVTAAGGTSAAQSTTSLGGIGSIGGSTAATSSGAVGVGGTANSGGISATGVGGIANLGGVSATNSTVGGNTAAAGDSNKAIQQYINGLPGWPDPGPEYDKETPLDPENRSLKVEASLPDAGTQTSTGDFICKRVQHDISKNHEEILNLGGSESALKPGIMLQGNLFRSGTLATIPLARSPITLSIDLAVKVTNVTVPNPTTATIQQAVADLQTQAGNLTSNLPAMVSYTRSEVNSMDQLSYSVGAALSYSGVINSVNFDASFKAQKTERIHTVVAKLYQPMYTISFADDEKALAQDFFAPSVTIDNLKDQEAVGNIGPTNQPVFVSSVTYGRMVIFTASSTSVESSADISAALDASIAKYKASAKISVAQQRTLDSLTTTVLAIGGNSGDVSSAITSGDFSKLFSNPDPSSAVPLTYVVKNLGGSRPTAKLGDVRTFVTEECTPSPGGYWYKVPGPNDAGKVDFTDVAANDHGEAFAIAADGIYKSDGSELTLDTTYKALPGGKVTSFTDITVDAMGWAYGLDNTGMIWKRDVSTGAWKAGYGTVCSIDAIGDGFIVALGCTAANSVPWLEDRNAWDGWTQATKPVNGGAFSGISLASKDIAWCLSGNSTAATNRIAYRHSLSDGTYRSFGDTVALSALSAASETEIWALREADHVILKLDLGQSSWTTEHGVPAPPEIPDQLDASTAQNLWITTSAKNVFRFIPPAK